MGWLALIFSFVKNKIFLYIVGCFSKFPIVKKADSLAADDVVKAARIIFTKFGLPKKFISDAVMKLTSDMFRQFCRKLNIQLAITPSYHHQNNGQMKVCIKFVNCTIKVP